MQHHIVDDCILLLLLQWLDDSRLVISSDKAKGNQPFRWGQLM
jgi:hypothetical protein